MERYFGKHQKEPGHQTCDTASPVDNVRSPGAVLLETERLVLRHFTMSDVGNLADLDAGPDVMRFITGGLATSRGEIQDNLLPGFMAWYRRPGGYGCWAADPDVHPQSAAMYQHAACPGGAAAASRPLPAIRVW
jgi:RimJ/RimL family protein N-acetyltransferase